MALFSQRRDGHRGFGGAIGAALACLLLRLAPPVIPDISRKLSSRSPLARSRYDRFHYRTILAVFRSTNRIVDCSAAWVFDFDLGTAISQTTAFASKRTYVERG
jgi:hypothetical protein